MSKLWSIPMLGIALILLVALDLAPAGKISVDNAKITSFLVTYFDNGKW